MKRRPRDIVDIDGLRLQHHAQGESDEFEPRRRWIAVFWRCCGRYSRIYINRQGHSYEGHCPNCARLVRARIGDSGTAARFFVAE
ncbi:MAG: hypothetical protein RLN76_06075 [Phycisphaeraceae bacterium]